MREEMHVSLSGIITEKSVFHKTIVFWEKCYQRNNISRPSKYHSVFSNIWALNKNHEYLPMLVLLHVAGLLALFLQKTLDYQDLSSKCLYHAVCEVFEEHIVFIFIYLYESILFPSKYFLQDIYPCDFEHPSSTRSLE